MLYRLTEIEDLLADAPGLFVRYSAGYAADLEYGSYDAESGLSLPGLAAHPLDPEPWWNRPAEEWLARQLYRYRRLGELADSRFAWVLRGHVVGRGPDGEPLMDDIEVVARLADCLLDEAARLYRERFGGDLSPQYGETIALSHA
jgi:hypothetical protein